jgi:putative flippase GtrA
MTTALKYALFALISMLGNFLSQWILLRTLPHTYSLWVALFIGTGIGLFIKYYLDKHYIFYHKAAGIQDHAALFSRYTLTGLATTAIYWGFEYTAHYFFTHTILTLLGGIIGISIGYWVKYHLDKRFTFLD